MNESASTNSNTEILSFSWEPLVADEVAVFEAPS